MKRYSTAHYQNLSSTQLLALLQNKDRVTFAFLYDKYSPALYGAILKKVGNQHIANEILTNTFIKIWQDCSTADCLNKSIFSWMYSIANSAINVTLSKEQHQKGLTEQAA